MLTRDLLRFRTEGDRLVPRLLKPTPAVLELCRQLLAHWQGAIGGRIGEVEDAAQAVLHGSRQLVVARGLQKILVDACTLEAPTTAEPLRARAFAASAQLLRQPLADPEAHRAAVAASVGMDPVALADALYADHPDRAVITAVPAWDEKTLVARYHLELFQGLLLGAQHLDVRVLDPERGVHRRLMQALRWRRLLAEATQHEGHLRLQISGPAAVLDQKTAYGMQFALFLPALCTARRWQAVAQVVPPRGHLPLRLELSDELHLPGAATSVEHVPAELAAWMRQIAAKLPDWRPVEPEPIILPGGEVVLPDWAALPHPGEVPRVSVELFHRWHRNALERRLHQLRAGQLPRFLIGVDRALAKQDGVEDLLDHPAVFRFSDLPAPAALIKALAAFAA